MDDLFNEVLELLAVNAKVAWTNTLSGCNSKAQDYYFEQMKSPSVGDLVLETSSIGRVPAIDRIGHLQSIQDVPFKDWEDEEPAPLERTWTIKTFDGRQFTWSNADFIVIPEDAFNHKGAIPRG